MLDATANNEAISRASIERDFANCNSQMSTHDVDDLLVGMTVAGAHPIFFHEMLGEKKLVVVGTHATDKTGLGQAGNSVRGLDEDEVGLWVVCHVVESVRTPWKTINQPLLIQVRHS
jgi:hypothetical protein